MNATINELVVELSIDAPVDHVWTKMTDEISDWWPRDFLASTAEKIQLENHVGGRLYEESADGGGILWGTVARIVPGSTIEFIGHMTPQFGGPSMTMIRMTVEADGDSKTKFTMVDAVVGAFAEDTKESMTQGWDYLWGALKAYCEK